MEKQVSAWGSSLAVCVCVWFVWNTGFCIRGKGPVSRTLVNKMSVCSMFTGEWEGKSWSKTLSTEVKQRIKRLLSSPSFLLKKKKDFIFLYECLTCMYVCVTHVTWFPAHSGHMKASDLLVLPLVAICKALCECWEWNLAPVQKQQVS